MTVIGTYLDQVCMSVAAPRMREDLGISAIGRGWVTSIFTLAYCVLEIPTRGGGRAPVLSVG